MELNTGTRQLCGSSRVGCTASRRELQRLGGTGSIIAGPEFANRDYVIPTGDWQLISHVFRVPDELNSGAVRLGVWDSSGTVQFDSVRIVPVQPVYQATDGLRLGAGESVLGGRYTFSGTYGQEGSNDHRPLVEANAGFNSDRWTVGGPGRIVYRFGVPGHPFVDGRVTVGLSYHVRGTCVVEVSDGGQKWRTVSTLNRVGTASAKLPDDLFPSSDVFVRVRTDAADSSFQVNEVSFDAGLQGPVADAVGSTTYAELSGSVPGLALHDVTLCAPPSSDRALELDIENKTNARVTLRTSGEIRSPARRGHEQQPIAAAPLSLARSSKGTVRVTLPPVAPGRNDLTLRLQGDGKEFVTLNLPYVVADYERDDYGERIAGVIGPAAVWWCDATHKIPRQRALPTQQGVAALLSAARNDHEAVQIVVRPTDTLKNLTATTAGLSGPGGATIPPSRIQVLREHYHFVHHPTDATGVRGWWPDALPPLARPVDVAAGTNQPLWVLVDVPGDAAPGDYAGTLALKADGWAAKVPVRLHVWNFTLPENNHVDDGVRVLSTRGLPLPQHPHGGRPAHDPRPLFQELRSAPNQPVRPDAARPDPCEVPGRGQPAARRDRLVRVRRGHGTCAGDLSFHELPASPPGYGRRNLCEPRGTVDRSVPRRLAAV